MSRRTRTKSTRTYRRVVLQQCEQHRTILVPRRHPAHNLAAAPMPTTPIARRRTNLSRKKTLGILNAGTKYCTWRVHTTQNGRQGSDPPWPNARKLRKFADKVTIASRRGVLMHIMNAQQVIQERNVELLCRFVNPFACNVYTSRNALQRCVEQHMSPKRGLGLGRWLTAD